MASFNRVILMGNVTRDIELKYIRSDMAVTELGLAVNDRRKNQAGEWVDETTFVDVTLWGRTAEIASEYLGKGSPVMIEGRLKLDTWETEGQKRSKLRVVGERLVMLPKGGGSSGGGSSGGASTGSGSSAGNAASGSNGSRGSSPEYDESEFSQPASVPSSRTPAAVGGPPKDDIPF